jgi:hypothetical protein
LGGIFAWLSIHAQPSSKKEPIAVLLRQEFPEMDATLKSYVQIIPVGQELSFVMTLIPVWKNLVLGIKMPIDDAVESDLFSA